MAVMAEQVHECLRVASEKWDGPFERPITWDRETGDLGVGAWALKVYKLTKAGNISRNGGGYLILKYCPLCGEEL